MKKLTLLLPLLLLAGCTSTPSQTDIEIPRETPKADATACTMDAKACPDGSYVGRTGPNCEFTPCPTTGTQVACTEEAKLCPDGSSVARVAPSCEFAACPISGEETACGITPDASCGTGK